MLCEISLRERSKQNYCIHLWDVYYYAGWLLGGIQTTQQHSM